MIKKHFSAVVLFVGLFLTQIIATVHVYLSNQNFYLKMTEIGNAGFFTVPNEFIIETLTHIKSAFCGGVFFTLTIGASVSVVSLLMIQVRSMFFFKKRYLFLPLFIMIICMVVFLNKNGFSLFPTLYFLIPPVFIALISLPLLPVAENTKSGREGMLFKILVHGIPVLVLVLLWSTQYNRGLFINLRDSLLLTNPVGNMVNDFYYKYTLYPAEIIKPLHQKTLKSYRFDTYDNPELMKRLEKKLIKYDYLNVKDSAKPDMTLGFDGGKILINVNGNLVMQVDDQVFSENPLTYLREFSGTTDRNRFFRKTILVSLLFGFPMGLYILIFHLFYFTAGLILNEKRARLLAAGLCFIIGLYFLGSVYLLNNVSVTDETLNTHMVSDKWQERVAALKYIRNENIEVTTFQSLDKKITSRYTAERYWLALSLGKSRSGNADVYLARLLNDSSPNVICQVFSALGTRRHKGSIPLVKDKIKTSNHWYEQWYGYGSLRKFGWRQRNKSD